MYLVCYVLGKCGRYIIKRMLVDIFSSFDDHNSVFLSLYGVM